MKDILLSLYHAPKILRYLTSFHLLMSMKRCVTIHASCAYVQYLDVRPTTKGAGFLVLALTTYFEYCKIWARLMQRSCGKALYGVLPQNGISEWLGALIPSSSVLTPV